MKRKPFEALEPRWPSPSPKQRRRYARPRPGTRAAIVRRYGPKKVGP